LDFGGQPLHDGSDDTHGENAADYLRRLIKAIGQQPDEPHCAGQPKGDCQ
jgi:hypothetical protein